MRGILCGSLVFLVLAGCVPASVKDLIDIEVASHDADLEEWETLTPEQRRRSYEASRDSFHILNYALFDVPLPPDLK